MPDSVRTRLVSLIDRLRNTPSLPGATSLGPKLQERLGIMPEHPGTMESIRTLIYGLEWWQVYDVCDALRDLAHDADTLVDEIETGSIGAPPQLPPFTGRLRAVRRSCHDTVGRC
jgi:hypothetical protein